MLVTGSRWGLRVRYVDDGKELVRYRGALRRALEAEACGMVPRALRRLLPALRLALLADAFLAQARPAMMTIYRNEGRLDSSNVRFSHGSVQIYRKTPPGGTPPPGMDFIDYGLTALRLELVADNIPTGRKFDLADVYHVLSLNGLLAGLEVHERFTVGSPDGLRDFKSWTVLHPTHVWANQ